MMLKSVDFLQRCDHKILLRFYIRFISIPLCLKVKQEENQTDKRVKSRSTKNVLPVFSRKSLSEVTACLRERLHRWQQIEKLCGFPVVNNSGLPSLTASLYSDHSWVVMPRVSVPPYPIAGGVDDLDEDTPPIIPQFTCK